MYGKLHSIISYSVWCVSVINHYSDAFQVVTDTVLSESETGKNRGEYSETQIMPIYIPTKEPTLIPGIHRKDTTPLLDTNAYMKTDKFDEYA